MLFTWYPVAWQPQPQPGCGIDIDTASENVLRLLVSHGGSLLKAELRPQEERRNSQLCAGHVQCQGEDPPLPSLLAETSFWEGIYTTLHYQYTSSTFAVPLKYKTEHIRAQHYTV